jgi:hypothetical protein
MFELTRWWSALRKLSTEQDARQQNTKVGKGEGKVVTVLN